MEDHRALRREEFGSVELGDARLEHRLGLIAAGVAEKPSGLVSEVFSEPKARQAAYDFLANPAVRPQALLEGTAAATVRRCEGHDFIFVPIDGTSLTLTDRTKSKPLGPIGGRFPARGLKVIDVIAITPDGTVQGLLDLQVWARGESQSSKSRYQRRGERDTEMRHWSASVHAVMDVLDASAPGLAPWFVMDREADESWLLRELTSARAQFTIRASHDRIVEFRRRRTKLFSAVRRSKSLGRLTIEIPRSHKRPARRAVLEVRAVRLTLLLPTYRGSHHDRVPVEVSVVELREIGSRRERLHWTLLTSQPVSTREEAQRVIDSYKMRWRIEEFHRTWKSAGCGVEDIQLRTADGIRKWAILLGAMAARIERLKHLARTQPNAPATIDLSTDEIDALRALKRRNRVAIPDGVPTIKEAVRWIGELGGYAGHYKGYEPGSKTLSRGLAQLAIRADAWACAREALENELKKR